MFLGIDGGGTKTAFVLINHQGRILAQHEERGAYYLEIGMEATAILLKNGTAATLAAAGISSDALQFAFFGLPSYGEDSKLQTALDTLPKSFLRQGHYRCGNDMICAWSGSLAGQDGINIIAGTGSIAYGEYAGRSARSGGWGELFSDEGSAYWIAREGLKLFSRMSDGRAEKSQLYSLFRAHFSLQNDLDLCAAIHDSSKTRRSTMAQLAKLVCQASLGGDTHAAAIFICAAHELAQMVNATRLNLGVPGHVPLPVSYSGGVFNSAALVLEPFQNALQKHSANYVLTPPMYPPAIGAALYAAKCADTLLDVHAHSFLKQECNSSFSIS